MGRYFGSVENLLKVGLSLLLRPCSLLFQLLDAPLKVTSELLHLFLSNSLCLCEQRLVLALDSLDIFLPQRLESQHGTLMVFITLQQALVCFQ